jgi:hypothetical protein
MEFSARFVLSSNSGYSKKRVSFFHSASAYWQALHKCAGRQSTGLRCLDLAANVIEKRSRCFLAPDMARRSSQRFAASFCIDGKQFVHLSHNRGCNRISGI